MVAGGRGVYCWGNQALVAEAFRARADPRRLVRQRQAIQAVGHGAALLVTVVLRDPRSAIRDPRSAIRRKVCRATRLTRSRLSVEVLIQWIRRFRLGDVGHGGGFAGSESLDRVTSKGLLIDDSTTSVGPCGKSSEDPDGIRRHDLPFSSFRVVHQQESSLTPDGGTTETMIMSALLVLTGYLDCDYEFSRGVRPVDKSLIVGGLRVVRSCDEGFRG